MDKTIAGLLGAVGALVVATPGHAAPLPPSGDAVLHANTYAELLRPVPNALATLRAMDETEPQGRIEQVQLGPLVRDLARPRDHHHHHHHHGYRRPPRRDHHHHHHNRRESVFR